MLKYGPREALKEKRYVQCRVNALVAGPPMARGSGWAMAGCVYRLAGLGLVYGCRCLALGAARPASIKRSAGTLQLPEPPTAARTLATAGCRGPRWP